jgi:NAD(P)-dependent dehydrogenase (short-subunit alcohol dehydrogenase family)
MVSVQRLQTEILRCFGNVDAVINNATIAVFGEVKDLPIEKWDASYHVNLRGPVLMARTFLPEMINHRYGVFVCVSSTGAAYLGGYETFKAAQVQLANTLDAELEGTGVIAFTIGPGLVPTETASNAVERLAPLMGMTVEEFFKLNQNALLTPEEAGAGFAVSIVLAAQFRGMEISSLQALRAAPIPYQGGKAESTSAGIEKDKRQSAVELCERVRATLQAQSEGWKERSIFERQWVFRDFRKTAGMSADEWLSALALLGVGLENGETIFSLPLEKLAAYYDHLAELAKGYEKNAKKLEESLRHVYNWRDEVRELQKVLE